MISIIYWDPVVPLMLLISSAVIAAALLVIIEWKRRLRFRWIRIVCQLGALIGIVGILARPTTSSSAPGKPVLILTSGYAVTQADSLQQTTSGLLVYSLPGAPDFQGATRLDDFRELNSLRPSRLWVAGEGIPAYALPEVAFNFDYLPGPLPEGVIDLHYDASVTSARWSSITGLYHPSTGARRLRLMGPGGIEDSLTLETPVDSVFSLSFFPKVSGKIVYTLEVRDSLEKIISSSRIPVTVEDERKLEVVFLNDHPSFEQRYLKNFLSAKGHRLSVRNRISKDRYHQEFANRNVQSLNKLTSALLDYTDLVIVDQATFLSLPNADKRSIRVAMERGLGVLLLAGGVSKGDQLVNFHSTGASDTARFNIDKAGSFTLPVATITPIGETTPWLLSSDGRALTGCLCTGSTKTGFQLLRETYQLGLQGEDVAYAAVWTPLLERVARKEPANFKVTMRTPFPWYSNEPIDFDVLSAGEEPIVTFDGMQLALAEDEYLDDVWHGRLWADGNRWHTGTFDDRTEGFDLLDLPDSEWNTMRTARQIRANRDHEPQLAYRYVAEMPVSSSWPIVFFLMFLMSSGLLWLTPKI